MNSLDSSFYANVANLLEQSRKHVRQATNMAMVYTYYEIGRMIFEEEQKGEGRAGYGQQLINGLSEYLTNRFGRGFSATNLKQMRQFYRTFSNDHIGQTLSDQFPDLPQVASGRKI